MPRASFPAIGSSGSPNGTSAYTRCNSPSTWQAALMSSAVGLRYSFPFAPSTTTAVIILPSLPARPSRRMSCVVMLVTLQQGQVTPDRDIVPAPTRLSCPVLYFALPPTSATSLMTPNTTPLFSVFGSVVNRIRLLSFLQSHLVCRRGIVALQCLQTTVRAHR